MSFIRLDKKNSDLFIATETTEVGIGIDEAGQLYTKDYSSMKRVFSTGITPEQVRDIAGAMMIDTSTVTLFYDDDSDQVSATVVQDGIDHTQISNRGTNTHTQIDTHIASTLNPHNVTKAQVGLSNVPNTDTTNPANIIQTASYRFVTDTEKTTWNSKENGFASGTITQYFRGDKSWQTLDKAAVGLGNVDNTSDLSKIISTATQTALNGKEPTLANPSDTSKYYRGDKTWATLDKAAVGLSNVPNTDTTNPANIIQTASYRFVTDTEKTTWNSKYDASNPNGYEIPTQLNDRDTANRARANHTGTQLASTISDFSTTANGLIDTKIAAHVALPNPHSQYLTSAPVTSVFTRTGAITSANGDYTASQINNAPSGGISATNVQAAINELDSEKYNASNPNGYETPTQLNARDTANRARANHTGTQLASTISDFNTASDARVSAGISTHVGLPDPHAQYALETAVTTQIGAAIDAHELTRDHPLATQALNGLMSSVDKTKLDNFIAVSAVKTTSNLTNSSNVTLTNISNLTMPVISGKSYAFNARIAYTSPATTTGICLALTNLNGATGTLAGDASASTSTTARTFRAFNGFNNVQTQTATGIPNVPILAEIVGVVIATASGDIVPQFRSESNGITITVLAGSTLTYTEI